MRVLADCGDKPLSARYKNGASYFFTNMGDLKKYEKGTVSTLKKVSKGENASVIAYFFDDYILYYDRGGQNYSIIYYSGKKSVTVDLAEKAS